MEAFATAAQFRAAYPGVEGDDDFLAVWLGKASRTMRSEMGASHVAYDEPSQDFADTLASVCCDVAYRAIDDGGEIPYGATQVNMTAGSYSRGASFGSSGYSSLFLTGSEKLALGIGAPKACALSPYGGGE